MKNAIAIFLALGLAFTGAAQGDYVEDWNPDADGDGNVGVTDLLALLSVFSENDVDGDGVWDSVDDCIGVYDPCGVCNGTGEDDDQDGLCDDVDDCVGAYDDCGVCNGPGPNIPVIDDILYETDSVFIEVLGEWYVFEYATDTLFTYVCPVSGCTDEVADNYNSSASEDDGSCVYTGQTCGIFFSEYAEGSQSNSYFEIYNPTNEAVDLGLYAIASTLSVPTNPGEHEFWNVFSDGAVIAPGEVYVWAREGSDPLILAEADQVGSISFNGDDALALVFGSEDDYAFVDIIGNFDGDPGSGWTVAGVQNATWNRTLVRKEFVSYGNSGDWFVSAGTNESDSEWLLFEEEDWSDIGVHTFSGSCSVTTEGCTDETASNYDPEAVIEDGSCAYGPLECGGASTVTFDGYTYDLVAIGDQCWFKENLRTSVYSNGDAIPGELSNSEWSSTNYGAQAIYGNSTASLDLYGRHYNRYAVDDARGLCPAGWHVPTDGEWTELTDYLGGESVAGSHMKSSSSDTPPWDGSNSSGFSGLPGGYRSSFGNFYYVGSYGYFGSSSPISSNAWFRILYSGFDFVTQGSDNQRHGFSVRCVRDE